MIKQRTIEIAFYFGASVALYCLGLYTMYKATSCICPEPSAGEVGKTEETFYCDTVHLERATTYQPTTGQCDGNPFTTADGSIINPELLSCGELRWVALSADLIWDEYRQSLYSDTTFWRGDFKFGDTITVYSKEFPNLDGDWIVKDVMSRKYRMSIDFLIDKKNNTPKLGVCDDVKILYCK